MVTATAQQAQAPKQGDGKYATQLIKLEQVVANTAQTRGEGVLPNLLEAGYGLFEKASAEPGVVPVWELLTSAKPEDRARGASLIEQYDPDIVGLRDSVNGNRLGMLQEPGVLKVQGGYDVIFGMRRVLSAAYAFAKGAGPETVRVKVYEAKLSDKELLYIGLCENSDRKDETPIDKAITFKRLIKGGDTPKVIGEKLGISDQSVRNYTRLLDPLLEDKRGAIRRGELTVDAAMKLLTKRKQDAAADPEERDRPDDADRARLPGAKKLAKIYEAVKKPKFLEQKEWELFLADDVRKLLAHYLGFKFKPFKGEVVSVEEPEAKPAAKPEANGHAAANGEAKKKVLKVKRAAAQELLISLGHSQARTWADKTLQQKLSNIVNLVEPGQRAETARLQALLERVTKAYEQGEEIAILSEK